MTQKNSENIYKALKEEERTLLEKNVTWMEKAFKRKEGYVTFGNAGGELVFCEGEFLSYLEGFQTIILKDGKQIAAYNWKIEDGIKNFQVLCSMKTDKSGKIFFCLIIRGDAPIIVGHTEEIEQESQYNLLIHAWDTETGYIWVGDNRDDGLTRIDYLISGNATGKQNFIEKLTAQSYLQKNSEEVKNMSKVNFKQKQKKLREQRVRQTGWSEGTWDCSFSDSNEVLQSDEAESPKGVSQAVFDERPKAREKIKKKLEAARHKPDPSVPAEKLSDYLSSLNARDAVPPPILVRDDIPDNVQESTLSKTASRPIFEPAIKKTSKTLSIVEMAGELKKYVHIISYGNTLYYYNNYYYTQLDAKQLIKLYRKYVDYELNNESSLHGYKDLYDCFMTDPKIECNEPEDEPIYAPLKNGVFELVEWKLHPHSPDQVTFTYIKAKYAPKAECPIFEGYLHRVTGGDPQLMERFWMVIGYLLIYPARGKFFIFMKGIGNSGKSVLGSFIRRLYPKESVSSIRLKNLKNQFGMASLATSVINFDMDMSSSRIDDEAASRLKQITGGDSMNIPRKYRDDALLERRIKFVFSSNHPLIIDGEDEALIKRIVYLPFNYAIPDNQQDPDLGDKIWAERDAIVTKALYYARKLVQRNYIFPEIPYVDSAKYSPVKRFVQEICDTSNINAEVALSDLYEAYLDFCKEKNIGACTDSDLRRTLIAMGFEHGRSRCSGEGMIAHEHPVSAFRGIRLRP